MISAWISAVLYVVENIILYKRIIWLQIVCLITYLIFLTNDMYMTTLLPVYFIAAVLPLLFRIRHVNYDILGLFFYFFVYIFLGIALQDPFGTFSSFISRWVQFLIIFLVIDIDITRIKIPNKTILYFSFIAETLLGLYLLFTNTNIELSGMARLVAGAQPITGNIAITVVPIIVYMYCKNKKENRKKANKPLLIISVAFLIWTILSGTRGYTILFLLCILPIYWDYSFGYGKKRKFFRIFLFIILLIFIGIISFIVVPEIYEKMGNLLRIQEGIGIRVYENKAALEFFLNAPLHVILFGIGLGGHAGDYSAFVSAISEQFGRGMWRNPHYLADSGFLFHNFYADVLIAQGMLGVLVLIYIIFKVWKIINYCCANNILLKRSFHLYWIGFLVMNYYRWSASCGIAEIIVLSLILKKVYQEHKFIDKSGSFKKL